MLRARFDGGCDPNPYGHASCACLIEENGVELYRKSLYLGEGDGMTNNVAEYAGLKLILEYLRRNPAPCLIIGDSDLVIKRMRSWSMNPGTGTCAVIAYECKMLAKQIKSPIEYMWQRRDSNGECDAMCDLEIAQAKILADPIKAELAELRYWTLENPRGHFGPKV